MLKINPRQFELFQQQAERQFAQKLQHALADKYPQMLSQFPDEIPLKIVSNMIDRARRWGKDWKSALAIFAELMISIALNFDQQAEANSDDLPYFLSAKFLNAPLTEQTARAIPLVFWDKVADFDAHQY